MFMRFLRKSNSVNLETEDSGTAINANCHNIRSSTTTSVIIVLSMTVMPSDINLICGVRSLKC